MPGEQTTTEPHGSHQPGAGRHDVRLAISKSIGPFVRPPTASEPQTTWTVEQGMERCLSITLRGDRVATEPIIARVVACVNACDGINPSAVPDVLDVLRKLLAVFDSPDSTVNDVTFGLSAIVNTKGRAAIAKAEVR